MISLILVIPLLKEIIIIAISNNTRSSAFTIPEAATFRDPSSPSDSLKLRWYHVLGK